MIQLWVNLPKSEKMSEPKYQTLLKENIEKLHAVAGALLEKEKLEGQEFLKIFDNADKTDNLA